MPRDADSVSAWLERLKAGDKDLPAQQLWQRYFGRLIALARARLGRLTSQVADEEDVALSAFDSFCRGALQGRFPQLEDRHDLWRLLVTITARKACDLKVSNGRLKRGRGAVLDQAALAGHAMTLEHFIACEPTPEFAAQVVEEYRHLLALLSDDALRKVAQWKLEGFTNKEIAAQLRCVPRTVERHLMLIRLAWRDHAQN